MSRTDIAYGILTAGTALIALYPLREALDRYLVDLPPPVYVIMLVLGVVLILVALTVLLALPLFEWLYARNRKGGTPFSLIEWLMAEPDRDFQCKRCEFSDLPQVHRFAREVFGDEHSGLERMRSWYRRNQSIFHKIVSIKRDGFDRITRFEGYFILLPLLSSACEQIREGELTGASVEPEHVAADPGERSCLYVGAVAARFRARPVAMTYLRLILKEWLEEKETPIYANPVTDDGRRVAEENGFSPVEPDMDPDIHWVEPERVNRVLSVG